MNTYDKIVKCRSCGYVGPCDPTCCEHPDYDGATAEEAYQAALASPEVQAVRDALWVSTEHNALHFGESHNTVIQGRAALAAMETQK